MEFLIALYYNIFMPLLRWLWGFRDLNNGVKCKVQGGEDDEYDDVVTAFGESIVWRSWAKIASFGIWKINVYTVVSTVTQYNIQFTYMLYDNII